MFREAEARKIEEVPEEAKEKERKSEKFFSLLQSSIDQKGNLLSLNYDYELSKKLFEDLGFEEVYQLFDDQEIMALIKQTLTDKKTNLIDKLKLARLLCDISDDLFDEDREGNSAGLLKFLYQSTTGSEAALLEKIYASAAISESGYNQYIPEPRIVETGHNPEEKYNLHDAELASLFFQFDTSAIKKLNADRGNHQFYEDLLPTKDYIVSQLNPQLGGIYSRKGDLVGWFNLPPELEEKELQKIKVEDVSTEGAASLTDKIVFSKTKPEELALFKIMESLPVRIEIKKQLGIELSDFPLRVQKQFLSFITLRKSEIIEKIHQFLDQTPEKKARNNRVTAFLSLEYDENLGKRILSLDENLETDTADRIFAKYTECVRKIQDIADYLHKVFAREKKYDEEVVEKIAENLLHHGKNLLAKFADQAQEAKSRGQKIDSRVILQQLENIKTGILLFASTFQAASREQLVDLEDVRNVSLETAETKDLSEEDKELMSKIHLANRPQYSPKLLEKTKEAFDKSLEVPENRFHILKHKDEGIIGFVRFDQIAEGEKYAGAFNIVEGAKGSQIGRSFLKKALDREAEKNIIRSIVKTDLPIVKTYVEEFGFNIETIDPDFEGSGEAFLKIARDDSKNKILISRQRKAEELVSESLKGIKNPNYEIFSFDLDTQRDEFNQLIAERSKNYLLTRYIKPEEEKNIVYVAFEKKPQVKIEKRAA